MGVAAKALAAYALGLTTSTISLQIECRIYEGLLCLYQIE